MLLVNMYVHAKMNIHNNLVNSVYLVNLLSWFLSFGHYVALSTDHLKLIRIKTVVNVKLTITNTSRFVKKHIVVVIVDSYRS